MSLDEFKLFLPSYLSPDSETDLYSSLKNFPHNINDKFYSDAVKKAHSGIILQGDGIKNLPVINLPKIDTQNINCIILSNTCDISLDNKRIFESKVCYAPILNLKKYKNMLLHSDFDSNRVEDHIGAIRKQRISQIFYLPKLGSSIDESLVFLDRINSCNLSFISKENIENSKIFSLSDYGFYVFLFKISVHFTRMHEKIDRNNPY